MPCRRGPILCLPYLLQGGDKKEEEGAAVAEAAAAALATFAFRTASKEQQQPLIDAINQNKLRG